MATYGDDMLKQLAAEADALEEAQRAAFEKEHGPADRSEASYGVHGSPSGRWGQRHERGPGCSWGPSRVVQLQRNTIPAPDTVRAT